MGAGVGLCGGEVQRGNTAQELRASLEVKAGTVSAEVGDQRSEAVTPADRPARTPAAGRLAAALVPHTEVCCNISSHGSRPKRPTEAAGLP